MDNTKYLGGADMEHGGADTPGIENVESLAESGKEEEASVDNTKALPMSPSHGSNPLATDLGGAEMEHEGADTPEIENVQSLAESEKKKEASTDNTQASQETASKETEELGTGVLFNPTDKEAITYLVKKIRGQELELPSKGVVNEVDLYNSDPGTLTEGYKWSKQGDNWYFFTRTHISKRGTIRSALNGFWRRGVSASIMLDTGETGRKKHFTYVLREDAKKINTGWYMQEYTVEEEVEIGTKNCEGYYSLCKVYCPKPRKSAVHAKEEENKSKKLRLYDPSQAQNLSIHQNSDNSTEDRDNSVKLHNFLPVNTDSSDAKCHSGVEEQRGEDDNSDRDNSVKLHIFFPVNTDSSDTKCHSGVEEQREEDHEDHEEERGEDDNTDRDNSLKLHSFFSSKH